MNKVLVTGGAGFIGSHMVDRLIDMGVQVSIIDDFSTGKVENVNKAAYCWKQNLATVDMKELTSFLDGVDTVFHMAALARVQPSIEEPVPFHNANVNSTHNLLAACKDAGVKKFIFSSSSSVYGEASTPTSESHMLNPISPYALHKLIGEQYCTLFSKLYDIDTVCLRYFNVYGNRMSLDGAYRLAIPIFASQIKEGKPCTIFNDGNQRRDFTFINDIVNGLISCVGKNHKAEMFELGTGVNYSINEIADIFGCDTKNIPNRPGEYDVTLCDYSKAKKFLGYIPKGNLKEYIKKWLRENA